MNSYNKLIEFLELNKDQKMTVAVHAYNISTYMTFEKWEIELSDGLETIISNEENSITVLNDEGIERHITDSDFMDVFPQSGSFELHTHYATIGFKLEY